MKLKFTKEQIVARIKMIDKRVEQLSVEQIDILIDRGYSILTSQYGYAFADEEVVSMQPFYDSGELLLTLDVQDDVVDVYDLYLTQENLSKSIYMHGIKQVRDESLVYRDNRSVGRVHVDVQDNAEVYDNVVIKYTYTPQATDDDIYVDSITMTTLEYAWASAIYSYMKDTKSMEASAKSMLAVGSGITMIEDEVEQVSSIFR